MASSKNSSPAHFLEGLSQTTCPTPVNLACSCTCVFYVCLYRSSYRLSRWVVRTEGFHCEPVSHRGSIESVCAVCHTARQLIKSESVAFCRWNVVQWRRSSDDCWVDSVRQRHFASFHHVDKVHREILYVWRNSQCTQAATGLNSFHSCRLKFLDLCVVNEGGPWDCSPQETKL